MTIRHHVIKISYMNSLEQSYIQLHSYNNNLTDEQYTGDRNPFFDLDYDLQRQHAKHVTHIIVQLSVPCLPSPYKKMLLFYR